MTLSSRSASIAPLLSPKMGSLTEKKNKTLIFFFTIQQQLIILVHIIARFVEDVVSMSTYTLSSQHGWITQCRCYLVFRYPLIRCLPVMPWVIDDLELASLDLSVCDVAVGNTSVGNTLQASVTNVFAPSVPVVGHINVVHITVVEELVVQGLLRGSDDIAQKYKRVRARAHDPCELSCLQPSVLGVLFLAVVTDNEINRLAVYIQRCVDGTSKLAYRRWQQMVGGSEDWEFRQQKASPGMFHGRWPLQGKSNVSVI